MVTAQNAGAGLQGFGSRRRAFFADGAVDHLLQSQPNLQNPPDVTNSVNLSR